MSTQGPNFPTTVADDSSIGTVAWSSPGDAVSNDFNYALASLNGNTSHYLKATGFNFSIPQGATITGITVFVNGLTASSSASCAGCKLVIAGAISGSDSHGAGTLGTFQSTVTASSGLDVSGLTPAIVNQKNFGVAVAYSSAGNTSGTAIDSISVTITYTPGSSNNAQAMMDLF